ncbi:hypothetical protein NL676_008415 [Syzygium grande]|nr:hypothetical protein NL676_008415 [Syzygium grande]
MEGQSRSDIAGFEESATARRESPGFGDGYVWVAGVGRRLLVGRQSTTVGCGSPRLESPRYDQILVAKDQQRGC